VEQDISIKQQLTALIADPAKVRRGDAPMLRDLAKSYPYFQPIHLLLAKATSGEVEGKGDLATAALYANGLLVHNFLHEPAQLYKNDFTLVNHPAGIIASEPDALDELVIDEVQSDYAESEYQESNEEEVYDEIGELDPLQFQAPIMENIVATDFFAFQDNFQIEEYHEEETKKEPEPVEEPVVISKYDDDKLPYTFLWWLAKTRKEHQQIFQPYATPKQGTGNGLQKENEKTPPELQQQYVEHIFHMQSAFDNTEEAYAPVAFKKNSKGSEIIESFIKNEPQISPPRPEAINNENKARKSAEDHNDLVSETLANIYIEQMLYDKAIETYEKLSLKFPEKSRYFADLIQSLEKKI
jgi:hypothetical protein